MNLSELWAVISPRVRAIIHQSEARGVRVIRTTTHLINSGVLAALSFDTVITDSEAESDAGACWAIGEPTKLYARRDGYYLAGGSVEMYAGEVTAATRFWLAVRVNGTTFLGANENHTISGKSAVVGLATGMFWLAAGEYAELIFYHTIGSAKSLSAATTGSQQRYNGWLMRVS